MSIAEQYRAVRTELDCVCRECGRNPKDVVLVAVSKTVDSKAVSQAHAAGACDFGENRPDDLVHKQTALPQVRWHFIGNVQSRRLRDIVGSSYLVHSVHKPAHLPKIDAIAREMGRECPILLEVNTSGEQSKGGCAPDDAAELVQLSLELPNVQICGLMTMAPQGDLSLARECFQDLSLLKDSLNAQFAASLPQPLSELSMGMSEDWREAVYAGATIVRIGRAIFSGDFA